MTPGEQGLEERIRTWEDNQSDESYILHTLVPLSPSLSLSLSVPLSHSHYEMVRLLFRLLSTSSTLSEKCLLTQTRLTKMHNYFHSYHHNHIALGLWRSIHVFFLNSNCQTTETWLSKLTVGTMSSSRWDVLLHWACHCILGHRPQQLSVIKLGPKVSLVPVAI